MLSITIVEYTLCPGKDFNRGYAPVFWLYIHEYELFIGILMVLFGALLVALKMRFEIAKVVCAFLTTVTLSNFVFYGIFKGDEDLYVFNIVEISTFFIFVCFLAILYLSKMVDNNFVLWPGAIFGALFYQAVYLYKVDVLIGINAVIWFTIFFFACFTLIAYHSKSSKNQHVLE